MKKNNRSFVYILSMALLMVRVAAQEVTEPRQIEVGKTKVPVKIDGVIDEPEWMTAAMAGNFINKWPIDSGSAKYQTEVRILFSDQFIYAGIKAFTNTKNLVVQTLKRDDASFKSEAVWIVLDPAFKNISGYTFGVNAGGAQLDGIVENASVEPSLNWDARWYSAVKHYDGFWTAEIAIPFNSIRFPSDLSQWGINFIRSDMSNNLISTWNHVPIQFNGFNLNYTGKLIFGQALPKPKKNNVFIPYITRKFAQNRNENSGVFDAGIDAKIALGTSLNMDITLNPDFSDVDVDRQIINLDRFSILLPERRTFFLENSDLFAGPFFSRKVGLTDDGRVVPIIAGIRLSGNVNPALRVGLMNVQTAKKFNNPAQNYTVAAVNQKILSRSNIRGIFINREAVGNDNKSGGTTKYNRVAGILGNFLSNNTKFNGGIGYFRSFNPLSNDSSDHMGAAVGFTNKNLFLDLSWSLINSNYITDLGFTPRLFNYDADRDTVVRIGVRKVESDIEYILYPKSKKIINMGVFFIKPSYYYNSGGSFNEFHSHYGVKIVFAKYGETEIYRSENSIDIPFSAILFSETGKLNKGRYNFGLFTISYILNQRRSFSGNVKLEKGDYYNGERLSLTGGVKYRLQPLGVFNADVVYNKIILNNKTIYPVIISSAVEIAFTGNLFLTTFLQYNTLIKNFNVNSRFQWRFRPMSDLNIVYTDNYLTEGFKNKNRTLVLKANVWLN